MTADFLDDVLRRADTNDLATPFTAFRSEVNYPVRGEHDIEVVFNHDHRVTLFDQSLQTVKQLSNVFEMQARGGFVKQKQRTRCLSRCGMFRKMTRKLQALRFTARKGGHGLAEFQITQSDRLQGLQATQHVLVPFKKADSLRDCHVQHVRDRTGRPVPRWQSLHLKYLRTITRTVAVGTTQIDVTQELHLDVFKPIPPTAGATAVPRIEAKSSCGVTTIESKGLRGVDFANGIERTDITCGIGSCRLANRRLVNEYGISDMLKPFDGSIPTGRVFRFALELGYTVIKDVLNQRGLARARHARYTNQSIERESNVDVFQVMFLRTSHLDPLGLYINALMFPELAYRTLSTEVLGSQRTRLA